jgi:molybdopterin converting factor small subunit
MTTVKIKVEVPLVLQQITHNQKTVEVSGRTVRDCLNDLIRQYPDSKEWFNESNPAVWVALNQDMVNLTEMDRPVKEGDILSLILLLGGG